MRTRSLVLIASIPIGAACGGDTGTGMIPVAGLQVSMPADTLTVGGSLQLTAVARDQRGQVLTGRGFAWASSDTARARVSESGLVSAIRPGAVTITASSGGHFATATLTLLEQAVASVAVDPDTVALQVGAARQLTAALRDARGALLTGREVVWSSSDDTKARVSATGLVTAVAAGTATITARSGGKSGVATVKTLPRTFAGLSLGGGGANHSCAIDRDGAAYCWGSNYQGQLGDGTMTSGVTRATPTRVVGGITFRTLAVGQNHTCGLTPEGTAYCWGAGGQLGDGTTSSREAPTRVEGGLVFASLSAGDYHSCGLTRSGAAYCWGSNFQGQLGDGTTWDGSVASGRRLTPTAVAGGLSFVALHAGGFHTCAQTGEGRAYCWGENRAGQLGDGTRTTRVAPQAVSGALVFTSIGAGYFHSCGATAGGDAYCWGANDSGQLGNGTMTTGATMSPTAVTGGLRLVQFAAGYSHTCGITPVGKEYCWGSNMRGQLGSAALIEGRCVNTHMPGTSAWPCTSRPVPVDGDFTFRAITGGAFYSCALTSGGEAYCWGDGGLGQLGDGARTQRSTPTAVTMP